jgi:hypothetical protein
VIIRTCVRKLTMIDAHLAYYVHIVPEPSLPP